MSTPGTAPLLPYGIKQSSISKIGLPLLCCDDHTLEPLSPPNLRLLELIRQRNPGNFLVISTAGKAPDSRYALSDLMRQKLSREASIWSGSFLSAPHGWGTRDEVRGFFEEIRKLGITPNTHPKLQIVICSNGDHLPRVKMHVNTYNTEHWTVLYTEANHPFEWREGLKEILTLFREVSEDILNNAFGRWRRWIQKHQSEARKRTVA